MQQLEKTSNYTNETFEIIKHIDENGFEYQYARELQKILPKKSNKKRKLFP